jgi:hypothetical protein
VKIKVLSGFATNRASYRFGQIVECPEAVGARMIAHGNAEAAPDSAQAEDTFDDTVPKEERPAPAKKAPEKAVKPPAPETATTGAQTATRCTGQTKQGNPCGRTPLPGTDRCAGHPHEE